MKSARAANAPQSFALRNLDAKGKPVERARFQCGTAALMKSIKLRKADGQIREVVGIDGQGRAHVLELKGDFFVTAENPTGWVLGALV